MIAFFFLGRNDQTIEIRTNIKANPTQIPINLYPERMATDVITRLATANGIKPFQPRFIN